MRDINAPVHDHNLVVFRFCRVPFGVASGLFLLSVTTQYHLNYVDSKVAKKIQVTTYVGNLLSGSDTASEAPSVYEEGKVQFNPELANLQSPASNSTESTERVPETNRCGLAVQKCIGILWDASPDTL